VCAGVDGRLYYDVGIRIQSYASRQQLAVTKEERSDAIVQEFDRVLVTTLGAANMRLYEFRLQAPYKRYKKSTDLYDSMLFSFRCNEVV
jgi:PsbP